jgi:hypothetical protein
LAIHPLPKLINFEEGDFLPKNVKQKKEIDKGEYNKLKKCMEKKNKSKLKNNRSKL